MFGFPTTGKLDDVGLNASNSNARSCAGYFLLPTSLANNTDTEVRSGNETAEFKYFYGTGFPLVLRRPVIPSVGSFAVLAIASLCAHIQFHSADSVLDGSTSAEPP